MKMSLDEIRLWNKKKKTPPPPPKKAGKKAAKKAQLSHSLKKTPAQTPTCPCCRSYHEQTVTIIRKPYDFITNDRS